MGRVLSFCFLLLAGPFLSPALAQAPAKKGAKTIHTVRFSYDKWSRVEPARYVLTPRPTRVRQGDLADRTRQLMRLLVAAKRGSYGDARLAFQTDYKTSNIVYVWLDKTKPNYHPIVMAETVYTFTENGAAKVIFPGVQPKGWTRNDVPFSAYVLSVPFWQVLPPANMTGALVQMPDGSLLPSEQAIDGLKKGDKTLIAAVWKYIDSGGAAALAAVNASIHLKFSDRSEKLIPLLQSANKVLRKAAIKGLSESDMPDVNAALRKVVDEDPDAGLQDLASSILAKSSDPTYAAAAQYHALKSKDPSIVLAATKALGSSELKEAGEQLIVMIGHEDYRVREAAISSLLKRRDMPSLVAQLKNEKLSKDIRAEVAKSLRKSGDEKAAYEAIRHLAVEGKGQDAIDAATALGTEKNSATFETLGRALKHTEAPVRRAAAQALAKLGKPVALAHLAAANLEDAETGSTIREAIRGVYAKQSLDFVMKGTKDSNVVLKRAAVATLGDMVKTGSGKRARKKILNTLRPLSKASDATIRAAAIRSFEIMAGDDVRPDVMRLAKDEAVEVQRAVAHALRGFGSPETTTLLLKYITSPDPMVVANAASSIGELKIKEALNPVIKTLGHKSVAVRRSATRALVQLGQMLTERKPLLSFFSERLFDADGKVRLTAIEGLRLVKDARSVTAMGALLQDPLLPVRLATLDAMADTGHQSAVEPVASALEDENKTIRMASIKALVKLKRKEAAALLQAHLLREKDTALIEAAKKAINQLK